MSNTTIEIINTALLNSNSLLSNVVNYDFQIRTTTPGQKIVIGNGCNLLPAITVSNNLLGVANTSPSYTIDVAGDVACCNLDLRANGTSNGAAISWLTESNTGLFLKSTGVLGITAAGSETVSISSNMLQVFGNVRGTTFNVGETQIHGLPSTYAGCVHTLSNLSVGEAGSVTTSNYNLYVQGTIYATGNISSFSDVRVKDNIIALSNAIDKVCSISGYEYTRKDWRELGVDSKTKFVGLLAQEVKEVVPAAVTYNPGNDLYGVCYDNLVALLVQALKELKADVDLLKNDISYLKSEKV